MENNEETTKKISTSEKTHAKNAENAHIAYTIAAGIGEKFNTNNPLIKLPALLEFKGTFNSLMQDVNEKIPLEQTAVGAQIAAFKLVPRRVSKTMKAAKGLGLAPSFLGNLQSTANRLYGVTVNKNTPDQSQAGGGGHSTSRRSYAGILESLDLFDEQIKSNPAYTVNEEEYTSAAITAWVESLRTLHNNALDAKIATRTARSARDAFAYNKTDGLLVRMNALKAYLETILEPNDPRLKQIKKLRFVDYSR
jgi:hypothetical protein